ncbi:hypothetical protein [Rhodococcoides yunnanense]|uniref:hypothetical protein n=1 Tax=Rhodococcoides yunnanense TaxID=278209 RepID=UPI0009351210|nr:hypothetical protein [Rhodococcus yunnanensis]
MTLTLRSALLSASIGKASGFRSSVGISVGLLAWFHGTKYQRLAAAGSAVATVGEFIGDKLPSTPSRLDPAPLGGRIAAGTGAAYVIARKTGEAPIPAAVVGGLTAIAGSYAGHAYRGWASTKIPPLAAAAVEDVVALAVGAAVLREVLA